jgi:hypothetical protein
MEESSDNELIDPQSKGGKFIQKLTERQKRMEERYFKKDGKPLSNLSSYLSFRQHTLADLKWSGLSPRKCSSAEPSHQGLESR